MRRSYGLSITSIIILINIASFFVFYLLASFIPNFSDYAALKPSSIIHGRELWTLVTSMFVHAGFAHLFFNMFSLWFVGSFVEKIIGRKRFLAFYIAAGIVGGIFFSILAGFFGFGIGELIFGSPDIAGVGASGAIFGLVGLLTILVPFSKVYLIAGPLIAIILQAIIEFLVPSASGFISIILSIYIFVSVFSIFSRNMIKIALPVQMPFWILPIVAIVPLVIIGLFVPLPIGNMAHFGGLVAGLAYGLYLRRKYKKKVKMLGRYFR